MTPSCGDLWPLGHSMRSARGSNVLRGSGCATLSLIDRKRCRKGYVLRALSRLLEESNRVRRGGGPTRLILFSDRSPAPLCPARGAIPSRLSRPSWTRKAIHKMVKVKKRRVIKEKTGKTTVEARVSTRHTTKL